MPTPERVVDSPLLELNHEREHQQRLALPQIWEPDAIAATAARGSRRPKVGLTGGGTVAANKVAWSAVVAGGRRYAAAP